MAATVKELEAKVRELQQQIAGLTLTIDKRHGEYQNEFLQIKQEVKSYLNAGPTQQQQPQRPKPMPQEWRMTNVRDFLNWKASVVPEKGDGMNIDVGDRLKKALDRDCGWAEGQLYINWCARVGREYVRKFWESRGFDDIPEGL